MNRDEVSVGLRGEMGGEGGGCCNKKVKEEFAYKVMCGNRVKMEDEEVDMKMNVNVEVEELVEEKVEVRS